LAALRQIYCQPKAQIKKTMENCLIFLRVIQKNEEMLGNIAHIVEFRDPFEGSGSLQIRSE
jgi:hypothetical protein